MALADFGSATSPPAVEAARDEGFEAAPLSTPTVPRVPIEAVVAQGSGTIRGLWLRPWQAWTVLACAVAGEIQHLLDQNRIESAASSALSFGGASAEGAELPVRALWTIRSRSIV